MLNAGRASDRNNCRLAYLIIIFGNRKDLKVYFSHFRVEVMDK
ncbi:MAG: hypothetical protein MW690_001523 [Methanophagales archaeon]|nr:hypothetical protein [Methanophagales archaeon]